MNNTILPSAGPQLKGATAIRVGSSKTLRISLSESGIAGVVGAFPGSAVLSGSVKTTRFVKV